MSIIEKELPAVQELDVPVTSTEDEYRRETLLRAAELVEKHGYQYGTEGMKPDGPYCLLGAVARSMEGEPRHGVYSMAPPATLIGVGAYTAYTWNDRLNYEKMPRKSFLGKRYTQTEVVASALRRLAHGASWEEATRL